MKKNIIAKIGAAAVVLTMVTTSLVGGTFAKYTSTVTGRGTAAVANWKIVFNDDETSEAEYSLNLVSKDTENVKENLIVPGDTGVISLKIDGSGTEVSYSYEIQLNTTGLGAGLSDNLKFYSDENCENLLKDSDLKGEVLASVTNKKVTKDIYWKLAESDKDGTTGTDNALAGKSGTFIVTMTATQKTASTPETPTAE